MTHDHRIPAATTSTPDRGSPGLLLPMLTVAVLVLVSLVASPAADAATVETMNVVNATGERFELTVDGQRFDVAPEELRAVKGSLELCDTCNLSFGDHVFEATTRDGTGSARLDTAAAGAPIEPSDRFDYSLVFHRDGDGYALSLYRDDLAPMPGDETRVEVRNVAGGGAIEFEILPNGENGGVKSDTVTGTLDHTRWVRTGDVVVNDYELRAWIAGDARTKENLVACQSDLELEGATATVVYVVGRSVRAADLDDDDVKDEGSLARVCRDLDTREPAFQRSGFRDGVELRAYAGAEATTTRSVVKDPDATTTRTTGPGMPYATTADTSGGTTDVDERPTVALDAPADGVTIAGGDVPLEASADDDDGIDRVEFRLGGTVVATATAAPWDATFDSTSYGDGSYDLTAVAVDTAGQRTTSAAAGVTIDNVDFGFTDCVQPTYLEENVGDEVRYTLATDGEADFSTSTSGASTSPTTGTSTTVVLSLPDPLKADGLDLSTGDGTTDVTVTATSTSTGESTSCTTTITVEIVDFAVARADAADLSSDKVATDVVSLVDKAESAHASGKTSQADSRLEKAQGRLETAESDGSISSVERTDVESTIAVLRDNLGG